MSAAGDPADLARGISTGLVLLPAVDVRAGRASQVVRGADDDPAAVAHRWLNQGATWLHLADLDRAFGTGTNDELLSELIAELPVPIQLSGGLRSHAEVVSALDSGAARVVLSSATWQDPDLVAELVSLDPERVAVGIDVRRTRVVARGSDLDLGSLDRVLTRVPDDARWVVLADASRDGSRTGADLELFGRVARTLGASVIASGGVAHPADLVGLRQHTSVTGVVLGAALHEGAFTLEEARSAARGDRDGQVAP